MKTFITAALSFLLLVAFVAPVSIGLDGIQESTAYAQSTTIERVGDAVGSAAADVALTPINFLLRSLGALFITIGAFILWLSGTLFNFAIHFGIINFATFANISGVPTAWALLRDITNIFFIFVFLAIGIGTILGLQGYGYKKLLPKLLIVAVLINFSLFFAKVGIDVAHGFAGAILSQSGVIETTCEHPSQGPRGAALSITDCAISYGPATAFIEQFGFVDFFGASAQDALGTGEAVQDDEEGIYKSIFGARGFGDSSIALLFGIFAFIFMSAAGIVFFGGAIILLMRIVKLLLLLITSAPALAASILPSTSKYWTMWYGQFLKEAFFAPILLLLLAISLLFLNTARGLFAPEEGAQASFAAVFLNGGSDSISLVVFFFISLGFLFMSIKLGQDMGIAGAKGVQAFASRRVTAAGAGSIAALGRNTIGRAASAANTRLLKSKFKDTNPLLARTLSQGLTGTASASFDMRSAPGVKAGAKSAGIDVGKVGKGFDDRVKESAKQKEEFAKKFEDGKDDPKEAVLRKKTEESSKVAEKDLADEQNQLTQLLAEEAAGGTVPPGLIDSRRKMVAKKKDDLDKVKKEKEFVEGLIKSKKQSEGRTKEASQREYAKNISSKNIKNLGLGSLEGRKAADAVKKMANKSKEDKDLDKLAKYLKDKAGDSSGGKTEGPAPKEDSSDTA